MGVVRACLVAAAVAGWAATTVVPSVVDAQQAGRSVWDGVYTEEQAARGAALYDQQCASCHGAMLGGMDAAPPLTGGTFAANWNGVNLYDMLQRIRVSMPMDDPGGMSRQQVADVLAYMLSVNRFPAGDRELPRQSGPLRLILFQAAKSGSGSGPGPRRSERGR